MSWSGVTTPVPRASDSTSGMSADAELRRQAADRPTADALLQEDGRAVVRLAQRLAQRHAVGGLRRGRQAPTRPRLAPGSRRAREISLTGEIPARERRRVDDGLEGGAGLAPRLRRAVEGELQRVAAAHERQHVAASPDPSRRAPPGAPGCPRARRPPCTERSAASWSRRSKVVATSPVRRVVAVEAFEKLLAQPLLRVAAARRPRASAADRGAGAPRAPRSPRLP